MRQQVIGFAAALALLAAGMQSMAHGQAIGSGVYQPPVSPYLNILRGGASAGSNYYNLVQPQLQLYTALNRSQIGISGSPAPQLSQGGADLLNTGHSVQFGNYSHYYSFGGINTGSGTGNRSAGAPQQQQTQGGFGQAPTRTPTAPTGK